MLTIIKNNYYRIYERLGIVTVMTILMIVSIIIAIYMTSLQEIKGHIVFVTSGTESPIQSPYLFIEVMDEKPAFSDLMKHKYDAYVWEKDNHEFEIETVKNDQFKAMLMSLLNDEEGGNPALTESTERGVGANIIGFLMMFLLMAASMNLFTFAEDKEQGHLERILCSPLSVIQYVSAHIFTCLSLYVPAYICLVVMNLLGFDIGFSLLQYGGLIIVIGLLGISFALLLFMLFRKSDHATMLGNSVIILTTILAGSFYSFDEHNKSIEWVISVLPQKHLLSYAWYVEQGVASSHWGSLAYAIILVAGLLLCTMWVLKQRYIRQK